MHGYYDEAWTPADERREQLADWWPGYAASELASCADLTSLRSCLQELQLEAADDGIQLAAVVDWADLPTYGKPGMAPSHDTAVSWDDASLLIPGTVLGTWDIIPRED